MEKLLDQLTFDQIITEDQARIVRIESVAKRMPVRNILLEAEFVSVATLAGYEGGCIAIDLIAADFVADAMALAMVSQETARRFNMLAVSLDPVNKHLLLATDDPANVLARDSIRREINSTIHIEYRRANTTEIKQSLDKCYGSCYTLQGVLLELDRQPDLIDRQDNLEHSPILRLVDAILQDAITRRASDIHLSPEEAYVQVRYRIDGVLQVACCLHIKYWPAMLVRIKVLSDIDIAETRTAQDGHIARTIHGQRIDFRVASFPLRFGENLVLRVLDRQRGLLSLETLSDDCQTKQKLRQMVHQPSGLLLVCGPTGSGKTTTLYALLRCLDANALNIMTLEDPVEYPMHNIRQTRVHNHASFGFAEGVRGVLRQDPDVILVGEVRDTDSCAMTCRAAMTGHLVLTSTHADNCIGAIVRLLELGVERSVIANVLTGVVAQRLIRKRCKNCQPGLGSCGVCGGTGYSGRIALFECMTTSDAFASLLNSDAPLLSLRKQAVVDGMVPLISSARKLVESGLTTAEELTRVFGEDLEDSA